MTHVFEEMSFWNSADEEMWVILDMAAAGRVYEVEIYILRVQCIMNSVLIVNTCLGDVCVGVEGEKRLPAAQ